MTEICAPNLSFFSLLYPFLIQIPFLSIVAATATSLFSFFFFFFFPASLVSSLLMHYMLSTLCLSNFLISYLFNDVRWLGGTMKHSKVLNIFQTCFQYQFISTNHVAYALNFLFSPILPFSFLFFDKYFLFLSLLRYQAHVLMYIYIHYYYYYHLRIFSSCTRHSSCQLLLFCVCSCY